MQATLVLPRVRAVSTACIYIYLFVVYQWSQPSLLRGSSSLPLSFSLPRPILPDMAARDNTHTNGNNVDAAIRCGVTPTYPVFTQYAGFNEWAALNRMVIVYPKMSAKVGPTSQLKSGCFDGYGK